MSRVPLTYLNKIRLSMPQSTSTQTEHEVRDARARDTESKRPYDAPMLTIYGRLTDLTEGGNKGKKNDAGGPSSGKL